MKKTLAIILALAMVFSYAFTVSAEVPASNFWDFSSEVPSSWLKTVTSSTLADNVGYAKLLNNNTKVDTESYGLFAYPDTTLSGKTFVAFDFYVPSSNSQDFRALKLSFGDDTVLDNGLLNQTTSYGLLHFYAPAEYSGQSNMVRIAPHSSGTNYGEGGFNYNGGRFAPDTWHKLELFVDPVTGKATYRIIVNRDASNPGNITECVDAQLATTANGTQFTTSDKYDENNEIKNKTSITRLQIIPSRSDNAGSLYIDNLYINQVNEELTLSSATPTDKAASKDSSVVLNFNHAIKEQDLKINNSPEAFTLSDDTKTLTYNGVLDYSTAYNITGTVTDVYGMHYVVNHSFTTEAKPGKSTINGLSYVYDMETTKGAIPNDLNLTQYDNGAVKLIGDTASTEDYLWNESNISAWRPELWTNHKTFEGDFVVNFKLKIDGASKDFAPIETLAVVLEKDEFGEAYESKRLIKMEYDTEHEKWNISYRNNENHFVALDSMKSNEEKTISMVFHPQSGTYDVYREDGSFCRYKLYQERSDGVLNHIYSNTNKAFDIRFVNAACKTAFWLDDFEIKQHLALDGAYLAGSAGNETDTVDTDKTTYIATLHNNSAIAEDLKFAFAAYCNSELVKLVFSDVTVPAKGTVDINESLENLPAGSTVKAFYLRYDSDNNMYAFGSDALPLLSLSK